MARPIIVGYEGCERSADALALAKVLADASGRRIMVTGVHTIELFVSAYAPELYEVGEEFRSRVEGAARDCGGEAVVLNSSSAARGLHELAEETDAAMVVLGSCHRASVGRVMAGSVAKRLLQGSPAAVAVAPDGFRDRKARLEVIGVGVDGSPESECAVAEASRLAEATGATVRLLAAGDHSPPDARDLVFFQLQDFAEVIRKQWMTHLEHAAELVADSVPTDTELLAGTPANALADEAENLDLLVVGSRGYGPLRRVILGSVSGQLVDSAPCPVLVVPRGAAERTVRRQGTVARSSAA